LPRIPWRGGRSGRAGYYIGIGITRSDGLR
jgi:hypothetical protein